MQRAMVLVALLIALCNAAVIAGPVSVVDSRGREVALPAPAARIVSLAPHVTELLFAAGAREHVVAVTDYSDYPQQATRLPSVGNSARTDIERLVAFTPDLVIAWQSGNSPADVRRIESLGIPVFVTEPRTLASIGELMTLFGRLAGTERVAAQSVQRYERALAGLRGKYAGRSPVPVFVQIWDRPLMTVSGAHLISDAIALCGGANVFADVAALAPTVSEEAVIARAPAVIIATRVAGDPVDPLARWRKWPQLPAVRDDHLMTIDPDVISRHTPRILVGIEQVCEAIDAAR